MKNFLRLFTLIMAFCCITNIASAEEKCGQCRETISYIKTYVTPDQITITPEAIFVLLDGMNTEFDSLYVDDVGVYVLSPAYRCPGCGRNTETGGYCTRCRTKGRDKNK